MKKKKQPTPAAETAGEGGATAVDDIKSLIKDYAAFFDDIIDRIPAKFYLPTADEDKTWYQGLSKAAKAAAKQKSIENTKKARRERLDPEKSMKTTEVLMETLGKEKKAEGEVPMETTENEGEFFMETLANEKKNEGDARAGVTLEDLRQRLQKRLEAFRAARGGGDGGGRKKEAERREKKDGKKRKRSEEGAGKEKEGNGERRNANENERDDVEKEVEAAAKGIEFGKVKLASGIDDVLNKKRKKKKLTKEEELKRALELEEAKKDPEKGKEVAKKHAWKAAAERAMGIKVHDNPKLLKQSLHKEKRKHKKSVEKWKNRTETTQKMKQEKQDKRKENIKAKIDRKKQAKIEKREKKLMRPGFEGRKEGFVNAE